MQKQKFDFHAVMNQTNFLTGAYAGYSAAKIVSGNEVQNLVKTFHPAISNAARPKHFIIKAN